MVLHKWAVVGRSPPAPRGLLPIAKAVPSHPRLSPADYKTPYILRPFVKDVHISNVQHIENRGMHREELSIERGKFPRMLKTLVIQTDGSLNEREFEFVVPPLLVSFFDRSSAHRQRLLALSKIGLLKREKSWEAAEKADVQPPSPSDFLCVNALQFPYCVPKNLIPRTRAVDPLRKRKADESGSKSEGGSDQA